MNTIPFDLPGCTVDHVALAEDQLLINAHTDGAQASCPHCGLLSTRLHSYYSRTLQDWPVHGRTVRLRLTTRRFRCLNPACPRQTFTERLPLIMTPYVRQTVRLKHAVYHIGQALGGEAAARLLKSLWMAVGADTVLRHLHRTLPASITPPQVLGVDDWAWRKGYTYGTILVDLEQHRVVDLLPDRTATTLAHWLRTHPGVQIVARDRSTNTPEASQKVPPRLGTWPTAGICCRTSTRHWNASSPSAIPASRRCPRPLSQSLTYPRPALPPPTEGTFPVLAVMR